MKYFVIYTCVTIAASSTIGRDPCTALCDEFVEGGLCGDFESHCMSNGNCWELFWDEQGRSMISGIFPNARRDRPVSCEDARVVMDAREASSGPPPSPRRHPTRITSPIPGVRGLTSGNSVILSIMQVLSHLKPIMRHMSRFDNYEPSSSFHYIRQTRSLFVDYVSEAIREMWSGSSVGPIDIGAIMNVLEDCSFERNSVDGALDTILFQLSLGFLREFQRGSTCRCPECEEHWDYETFPGSNVNKILTRDMENMSLREVLESHFRDEEDRPCPRCDQSDCPLEGEEYFDNGVAGEVFVFGFYRESDTSVEFPLEMDLADMPGRGHGRYRLVGIVNDSHIDYSQYRSGAQYYTEFAIEGHWYLIDGDIAYDLGNQPTTTDSKRVRHLFYERIEEANISTTNTGSTVLEITNH